MTTRSTPKAIALVVVHAVSVVAATVASVSVMPTAMKSRAAKAPKVQKAQRQMTAKAASLVRRPTTKSMRTPTAATLPLLQASRLLPSA